MEKKYSSFYGSYTIWIIETKEVSSIKIDYYSKLKKGKFKVVLVTPEKDVESIFEQNQYGNTTLPLKKGRNRIKMVGKDAAGSIKMKIILNGTARIQVANEK